MRAQDDDGVPDAGLNINPDRIASQRYSADDLPGVVESEERQFTLQHDKRLGLRRIAVPMRRDVRALDHHIQESVGVIFHAGMEIVIDPQARGLARAFDKRVEESRVD
jgi:hypothetical protein